MKKTHIACAVALLLAIGAAVAQLTQPQVPQSTPGTPSGKGVPQFTAVAGDRVCERVFEPTSPLALGEEVATDHAKSRFGDLFKDNKDNKKDKKGQSAKDNKNKD